MQIYGSVKCPCIWQTYSGEYKPSWAKFRYGAWYLPAKTWKKMDAEEPLQDPKELKDQEMSESKKKSYQLVNIYFFLQIY